jgi:hypothetical protein
MTPATTRTRMAPRVPFGGDREHADEQVHPGPARSVELEDVLASDDVDVVVEQRQISAADHKMPWIDMMAAYLAQPTAASVPTSALISVVGGQSSGMTLGPAPVGLLGPSGLLGEPTCPPSAGSDRPCR